MELITNDECTVSQKIEIRVDTLADVYVPNIFSPNGDGSNDLFWIHGEDNDIMIESLLIYDRWGSLVYEAEDMPVGESLKTAQDGKSNDNPIQAYDQNVLYTEENQKNSMMNTPTKGKASSKLKTVK